MQTGSEDGTVGTLAPTDSQRRPYRTIALYLVALAFLAIVIWRSQIWSAGDTLDDVSPAALAAVILMCLLPVAPLAIRGRELLLAIGYTHPAISLAPVSFYGNTAGFLTPVSSGELLRPALLERGFGIPAKEGAGVVVYERLYSFLLLGLSGVIALTWTGLLPWPVTVALVPVFAITSVAPPLLFMVSHERLALDKPGKLLPHWISKRMGSVEQTGSSLKRLLTSRRLRLTFPLASYVVFALMIAQFWLLTEGLGENISPAEAGVVLVFANLAGVLSALPLGLGAMDVTMVALLKAYDVDVDSALAVVVLARCLIHLPTGILGLAAYVITLRQRPPGSDRDGGRTEVTTGFAPNPDAHV